MNKKMTIIFFFLIAPLISGVAQETKSEVCMQALKNIPQKK
jgi:hypothetical protein